MTNYMDEIIKDSLPIWEECINSKFVQGLINGTLTDEQITKYIVEDTKGFRTDVYKLKKKIFEYQYSNLTINEI